MQLLMRPVSVMPHHHQPQLWHGHKSCGTSADDHIDLPLACGLESLVAGAWTNVVSEDGEGGCLVTGRGIDWSVCGGLPWLCAMVVECLGKIGRVPGVRDNHEYAAPTGQCGTGEFTKSSCPQRPHRGAVAVSHTHRCSPYRAHRLAVLDAPEQRWSRPVLIPGGTPPVCRCDGLDGDFVEFTACVSRWYCKS